MAETSRKVISIRPPDFDEFISSGGIFRSGATYSSGIRELLPVRTIDISQPGGRIQVKKIDGKSTSNHLVLKIRTSADAPEEFYYTNAPAPVDVGKLGYFNELSRSFPQSMPPCPIDLSDPLLVGRPGDLFCLMLILPVVERLYVVDGKSPKHGKVPRIVGFDLVSSPPPLPLGDPIGCLLEEHWEAMREIFENWSILLSVAASLAGPTKLYKAIDIRESLDLEGATEPATAEEYVERGLPEGIAQSLRRVVDRICSNPYDLSGVRMLGWKSVDKFYLALPGTSPGDRIRRVAAAEEVLTEEEYGFCKGHMFTPRNMFFKMVSRLLKFDGLPSDVSSVDDIPKKVAPDGDRFHPLVEDVDWSSLIHAPVVYRYETYKSQKILADAVIRMSAPSGGNPAESSTLIEDPPEGLTNGQRYFWNNFFDPEQSRLQVLTGYPGTGKSFMVNQVVEHFGNAIVMAPTGKAASLVGGRTIHSWLYSKDFDREIEKSSLVVVDEASMIPVGLMAKLLSKIACRPGTMVLLVGDRNQLAPIGPGKPFCDIIDSGVVTVSELRESVRHGENDINEVCRRVARMEPVTQTVPPTGPVRWREAPLDGVSIIEGRDSMGALEEVLARLNDEGIPPWDLDKIQIITPTNGAMNDANITVQRMVQGTFIAQDGVARPMKGDKVLWKENIYSEGICGKNKTLIMFNGQLGNVKEKNGELMFEDMPVKGNLSKIMVAYAMTLHRFQGSEADYVVVILDREYKFVDTSWIYTAISRARKGCIIITEKRKFVNKAAMSGILPRRTCTNKVIEERR